MSKPIELNDVVSRAPLVFRRRIGWADTDAARIAYTVRFFEFAMAGIEAWFREVWGMDWFTMHLERSEGSPFVHVEMDIAAPLVPGDILDTTVRVEKLGTASIGFHVQGRRQDDTLCFTARFVCVTVTMDPMRSAAIPADKRRIIEAYMAAAPVPDTAADAAPKHTT